MQIEKKYVLTTLPFIFFALGYIASHIIIGNKTYPTPNLTGLSIHEAVKYTSNYQMNIRIISEKESKDIPEGTILHQKPNPGRMIKAHQPIFVTTTKAPAKMNAPMLIGQPLSSIITKANDSHIKIKEYPLEYLAPESICIGQIPEEHATIGDQKMTIYIAQPKTDTFLMPDFTNYSVTEVQNILKNHPIKLQVYHNTKKIAEPYNESMTISNQKPIAGSIVSFKFPLNVHFDVFW